jgi:hypothetical protein
MKGLIIAFYIVLGLFLTSVICSMAQQNNQSQEVVEVNIAAEIKKP